MAEKKKQHYVPQFYLRNFTFDGPFMKVMTTTGKIIPNAPYKNQCYSDYYYGTLENEDLLSELESLTSPIIKKLCSGDNILALEEIKILKEFILYQYFRTEGRESIELSGLEGLKQELEAVSTAFGKPLPQNSDVAIFFDRVYPYLKIPDYCLVNARNMQKYIVDLDITVINFSEKDPIISSDNPVAVFNNYYKQNIGFQMAGIVFIMPINPYKLLVMYDSKMYNIPLHANGSSDYKYMDIYKLNYLQLYNANKIAFGTFIPFGKQFGKKMLKAQQQRKKRLASITKSMYGPGSPIMHNEPFPLVDTSFSFLKLREEARAIPESCRDYFPRFPDNDWIKRLDFLKILPQVLGHVSPKYSNRNYTATIEFQKKYWNEN